MCNRVKLTILGLIMVVALVGIAAGLSNVLGVMTIVRNLKRSKSDA